jgi:hypothetical protein
VDTVCVPTYDGSVKNITLAIDDKTLEASRAYAERHQTTLNGLVRELLVRTTITDRQVVIAEMFRLMDAFPGHSGGQRWTREDLHAR